MNPSNNTVIHLNIHILLDLQNILDHLGVSRPLVRKPYYNHLLFETTIQNKIVNFLKGLLVGHFLITIRSSEPESETKLALF